LRLLLRAALDLGVDGYIHHACIPRIRIRHRIGILSASFHASQGHSDAGCQEYADFFVQHHFTETVYRRD